MRKNVPNPLENHPAWRSYRELWTEIRCELIYSQYPTKVKDCDIDLRLAGRFIELGIFVEGLHDIRVIDHLRSELSIVSARARDRQPLAKSFRQEIIANIAFKAIGLVVERFGNGIAAMGTNISDGASQYRSAYQTLRGEVVTLLTRHPPACSPALSATKYPAIYGHHALANSFFKTLNSIDRNERAVEKKKRIVDEGDVDLYVDEILYASHDYISTILKLHSGDIKRRLDTGFSWIPPEPDPLKEVGAAIEALEAKL
jgi:hypothetical protein